MSALFITFEGLDGSGKSTQLQLAAEFLSGLGREHVMTHEPGGTETGERLRAAFLDPSGAAMDGLAEAMVVFASRRQHLIEVIEPALGQGRDVLCDRFTDSTRAYQGSGRGLARASIDRLDELATEGRSPDLTLIFDLPVEVARQRGAGVKRLERGEIDRLDAEGLDFYRRVRAGYLSIAEREPERVRLVDASGTVEQVQSEVRRILSTEMGLGR